MGLASEKALPRVGEALALAESQRTTGDQKRESSKRMEVSRDQNRGCAGVVAKPRGSGVELATDAE